MLGKGNDMLNIDMFFKYVPYFLELQILESEKKSRIISLLGLKSARYEQIHFNFDNFQNLLPDVGIKNTFLPLNPDEMNLFIDFFDGDFEATSGLIYISDQLSYKMNKRLTCQGVSMCSFFRYPLQKNILKRLTAGAQACLLLFIFNQEKLQVQLCSVISIKYESSFFKKYEPKTHVVLLVLINFVSWLFLLKLFRLAVLCYRN